MSAELGKRPVIRIHAVIGDAPSVIFIPTLFV